MVSDCRSLATKHSYTAIKKEIRVRSANTNTSLNANHIRNPNSNPNIILIPALLLLLVCECAGGILGFPQLVYSLRYSQGKRQGRRLPCLHPSTDLPVQLCVHCSSIRHLPV